jgi:hypothetical protein
MGDYVVGFGKPPRQHQFKKGVCPNRRGRGKAKRLDAGEIFERVMDLPTAVAKRGRKVTVALREFSFRRCASLAVKGDMGAAELLIDMLNDSEINGDFRRQTIYLVRGKSQGPWYFRQAFAGCPPSGFMSPPYRASPLVPPFILPVYVRFAPRADIRAWFTQCPLCARSGYSALVSPVSALRQKAAIRAIRARAPVPLSCRDNAVHHEIAAGCPISSAPTFRPHLASAPNLRRRLYHVPLPSARGPLS